MGVLGDARELVFELSEDGGDVGEEAGVGKGLDACGEGGELGCVDVAGGAFEGVGGACEGGGVVEGDGGVDFEEAEGEVGVEALVDLAGGVWGEAVEGVVCGGGGGGVELGEEFVNRRRV